MTLDGKDIIPRHRTGKGDAVLGRGGDAGTIDRIDKVAVYEVETRTVVDAAPQRMTPGVHHTVPAHVRHFQLLTGWADHLLRRKTADRAGENAETGHVALFALFEEHLQADADAEEGFRSRRLDHD